MGAASSSDDADRLTRPGDLLEDTKEVTWLSNSLLGLCVKVFPHRSMNDLVLCI